jgi:hypothetical protein
VTEKQSFLDPADLLQSQGINANQIRQDADARRAAARASHQAAGGDDDAPSPDAEPEAAPARKETKAQAAKRKKEEEVTFTVLSYQDYQLTPRLESHC